MANEKNLIPNSQRTPKELREMTVKGGKRSGEVRRANKTARELATIMMNLPLKKGKTIDAGRMKSLEDIKGANLTTLMVALYKQMEKASKGDLKSLEFLINTMGQNFQTLDSDEREQKRIEKEREDMEVVIEENNSASVELIEMLKDRKIEGVDDVEDEI